MKNGDRVTITGIINQAHEDGTAFVALPTGQSVYTDLKNCEPAVPPEDTAIRIVVDQSLSDRLFDQGYVLIRKEVQDELTTESARLRGELAAAETERDQAKNEAQNRPTYGEAEAKAYAEANGLTLVPIAELDDLRALATDGKTAGEAAAAKKK